jgi:branched-chain amino acid transport system substrate-binding protein
MGDEQLDTRSDLTRRALLWRAGGAIGAAGLAPAVLAACGSSSSGGSSTGGGGSGGGEALKIGYVTPSTGPLADFAAADDFIIGQVNKAFANGLKTRKGTRDVQIIVKDSQSSSDRAGAVASDLILKDGVNLMLVASTPETTNPVSDQCELNGTPCLSTVAPWQSWFFGRKGDPEKPFKFTYHYFWGLEDLTATYLDMWGQVQTNKSVGALWPNDSDGNAFADPKNGFPPVLSKAGYKLTDPGRYEDLTNSYSAQISRFKDGDCEILTGVPLPPDFKNFYTQAAQQGYQPKVATIAKAILFPAAVDALGDLGENLSSEVWWSPQHPFSSSLNDETAEQLADGYSKSAGKQWTQPIGFVHSLFEMAADVLGRASDPTDADAIVEAIKTADVDTIVGNVNWQHGPVPNVAKTPLTGGQWVKGTKYPYDLVIVSNKLAPEIPRAASLQLIG